MHRAFRPTSQFDQHVLVAHDERTFRHQAHGRLVIDERLERAASDPVVTFYRLIRIGCRTERH